MKLEHLNKTLFSTTAEITSDAEAREIIMEDLPLDLDYVHVDDQDDPGANVNMRVVTCVLLEMALSVLGILTNLLGK